jgi:hypothetical protein
MLLAITALNIDTTDTIDDFGDLRKVGMSYGS